MQNRWLARTACVAALVAIACPRVARADDAACIAAVESEATLQKAAKLHEALRQAAACADPTCPADIRSECTLRIAKMSSDMPTIVLGATDEDGNDLASVTVTLDGAALVTTLDGKALAVDPGSHVLVFSSPGKPSLEKTVVLRQSEKDRRIDVRLGTPHAAPLVPPPPVTRMDAPEGTSTWSTRKTLALVSGGVGVVGVGLGAGLGASAIASWSSAKNACNPTSCPASTRANAESDRSASVTAGDVSTVAFIVGAAAIAGGAYLWLSAPKPDASGTSHTGLLVAPAVVPGMAGLTIGGSFQ